MSDLAPVADPRGTDLRAQMDFAQALAGASLLPRQYQKQPANVLLAMQLGQALQIPPIQAINSIHVIDGKPSASADLLASLVRRAGHKLRVTEEATADGPRVTATLIRHDDPEFEFHAVWDRAKVRAAGLGGRDNWRAYEGQMMRARAVSEVCRMGASDALYGVIYTPEELDGSRGAAQPAAPIAEQAPLASSEQLTQLREAMQAASMDGTTALALARETSGRPDLASATELTTAEADALLERLRHASADVDADEAPPADSGQRQDEPASRNRLLVQLSVRLAQMGIADPAESGFYAGQLARIEASDIRDLDDAALRLAIDELGDIADRDALEAHLADIGLRTPDSGGSVVGAHGAEPPAGKENK